MSTLDTLRRIIARITHCGREEITLDMALQDVKADSLAWLQIIVGVENSTGIQVDIERMKEMVTIGDFVTYIDSCTEEQPQN